MNNILQLPALKTPCYYYDLDLLRETLRVATHEADKHAFRLHYAVKANANPRLLALIRSRGLGADCVSGNEVAAAIDSGFPAADIVYAGVGKSDDEIRRALEADIFCFNCESFPEMEVINGIAASLGLRARVALRVNPNVDAHTHRYITTGVEENKFGFYLHDLEAAIRRCRELPALEWLGLHFHVGSQITDMEVFCELCARVSDLQRHLAMHGLVPAHVNFGGGLGVDYDDPDEHSIPNFAAYLRVFADHFEARPGQQLHLEPGRSLVAQCGSLVSRVLYVKEGRDKKFIILDAGMSDLIRPALYQAHHAIENLTPSSAARDLYDVVGPICESSDCFAKAVDLPVTRRGDLIVLRSAGAYGEVMASRYNLRDLPPARFSDEGKASLA
ncbi:MAG: diaminopimelate decarboxylase [Odoribacteraceae bacterium]|jgi:diaminopimelate decarboxylase|nr:diaminopimelate decarboxylase [Odoribacteraceae bacterium]